MVYGPATPPPLTDAWHAFEGTWTAAGTRQMLHLGLAHRQPLSLPALAFAGLGALLATSVLTIADINLQGSTLVTFFWLAVLFALSGQLNELGPKTNAYWTKDQLFCLSRSGRLRTRPLVGLSGA